MELFPAQPDLSLQISPPNPKPSSTWRRTSSAAEEEVMDLGFWRRALDSRNSISSSMASKLDHHHYNNNNNNNDNNNATSNAFELSLSNPNNTTTMNTGFINHRHHQHFQNTIASSFPLTQQRQQQQQQVFYQNAASFHHQQQQGLSQELGFLRPIRGIPVYQNHQGISAPVEHHSPASPAQFHNHQGLMRSRFLSRFPAKRSMRAPRMRWTTTLHARFVHAVELLGGHESKYIYLT